MVRNPVGDNEAFSAAIWSARHHAHNGEYVEDGLVLTKGTGNFEVNYTAGRANVPTRSLNVPAGSVTLPAPNATNPRVDLITVEFQTDSVTVVSGNPAADPVAPAIPVNQVLIGVVFVPAGAASLTAADIHNYSVESGTEQRVRHTQDRSIRRWGA